MHISGISLPVEPVDTSLFKVSDEIVLKIFLKSIESSPFHDAKATYFHGQLTSRRFVRVFNNPKILASLLKSSHCLPLKIIRMVPCQKKYTPLLKRTYEGLLGDVLNQKGRITDALNFLEGLREDERARITYVSFSLLEGPRFRMDKDFRSCLNLWMEELSRFFHLLPHLQSTRLPSQLNQFPYFFRALAVATDQIIAIEMQQYTEREIVCAVNHFPKLRSISLADCGQIGNDSLLLVLKIRLEIIELKLIDMPNIHLENLTIPEEVSLRKVTLSGANFTGKTTSFLLERFPNLESLNIASTKNDEEAIGSILHSSLPLKELDLSHLAVKNWHFLEVSPILRKNLKTLKLYGCSFITNEGIKAIKNAFPHLEYLDIRFCKVN